MRFFNMLNYNVKQVNSNWVTVVAGDCTINPTEDRNTDGSHQKAPLLSSEKDRADLWMYSLTVRQGTWITIRGKYHEYHLSVHHSVREDSKEDFRFYNSPYSWQINLSVFFCFLEAAESDERSL